MQGFVEYIVHKILCSGLVKVEKPLQFYLVSTALVFLKKETYQT